MGCGASAEAPKKKTFVFRCKLIGGLNLYNNGFGLAIPGTKTSTFQFNGKSDPYVKIVCPDPHNPKGAPVWFKSKTILHEQNPVWNEEFYFAVDTTEPTLEFRVFDAEAGGFDDKIGHATVNLKGMISKEKEQEYWVPLSESRSAGEIGFSVVECYRMNVMLKQGVDLKAMDGFSGSSDCYATIQVGQQERQKSKIKGWTLNPVWNEQFQVYVPYGVESQLQCILWDNDKIGFDANMGWAYTTMQGKPEHGIQREVKLKVSGATGELQLMCADDTEIETAPGGAVTAADKEKFPPKVPQTATFQAKVLGAYNLAAADANYSQDFVNAANASVYHEFKENTGNSDPFARVEVEGQIYDTHHINNTLEPIWNSNMRFVARSKDTSELVVRLYDHDIVSNDCIGAVRLPLNMMKPGERTEMWSFLDKGRGEVGLELSMDFQLKVRIVSGKDFPAKDMNGMCDPYVKLKVSGKEYQTRTVRDNRSPWFEEDFRFALPTLKDAKLDLQVWDADFTLLSKKLSEDLIGAASVDLDKLAHGVPVEMEVPLMVGNQANGSLRIIITDEIPIPKAALQILEEKGKEAFNSAVAKLSDTADVIKTLKMPDFEKQEEEEVEPFDPKIDNRPRFSRMAVEVVAARGLPLTTTPVYFGVSVPVQGSRFRTKEYKDSKNPDVGETFQFRVPSKITGGLEITVWESNKSDYLKWHDGKQSLTAFVPFSKIYEDGVIRGSPADHFWVQFPEGGEVCISVFEMFRWNVRVKSAEEIATKSNPFVELTCGTGKDFWKQNTHSVSKDPAKDRTEGVPGKPIWNEQFTLFTNTKKDEKIFFKIKDEGLVGDAHMGEASLSLGDLRRGVPKEFDLPIDKGGRLFVWIKEEEKMALMDRVIDGAKNAAKLAQAAASEAADKAKEAVSNAASAVTGALGGLLGK